MAWARVSQLDRIIQCVGSAHLYNTIPATRLARKSENSLNAAEYGTLVHYWKQHGIIPEPGTKRDEESLARYTSARKTFQKKLNYLETRGITREMVWNGGWHEVSIAYNCIDGRVGIAWEGNADKFKAAHPEPWYTGTADWVDFQGTTLHVNDLKTGAMFDSEPDEMAQMYGYIMPLVKYFRPEKIITSVTTWPKYPIENEPERTEGEISLTQIYKFEDLIKRKYNTYITKPDTYRLGEACTFCPVIGNCPLQNR